MLVSVGPIRTPPYAGAPPEENEAPMRRGFGLATFVLIALGVELSTEGITLILARVQAGLGAVAAGAEFHVGTGRFLTGLLFLVVGLVMWGLIAWSYRAQAHVAVVGSTCPQCGNDTRRVKRKEWQKVLSYVWGERLTRRRCETCHWTGLSLRH